MKYLLVAPSIIACALFAIWPVGELVAISLYKTNFITSRFVGLANYVRVFGDPAFIRSMLNSLWYAIGMVTLSVGGAVTIALLVMRERKSWHDAIRILMYLPVVAAGIIIAQVWRWIFHAQGPINWILGTHVQWFAQGATAIPAIVVIVASTGMGGMLIVVLAAILGIDTSIYDAAVIDGAPWWMIKVRIVLPMISRTIGVLTLLAVVAAPQVFETIYALAPFEYAATMGWVIYREAFVMSRHGPAAAMSMILLVMMMSIALVKQRVQR